MLLEDIPQDVFIHHIFRYFWDLDDLNNISRVSETLCIYISHYKKIILIENYDSFNEIIEHHLHTKIKFNYIGGNPTYENGTELVYSHDEIYIQCHFCNRIYDHRLRLNQCCKCDRKFCSEYFSNCPPNRICEKCNKVYCHICCKKYINKDGVCMNCYRIPCGDCGIKKRKNELDVCHYCEEYSCCTKELLVFQGLKPTCVKCFKIHHLCDICHIYDTEIYNCVKCDVDVCELCLTNDTICKKCE